MIKSVYQNLEHLTKMEKLFIKKGDMDVDPPNVSISNTEESDYYATSFEHVLAELERIDVLLRSNVYKARSQCTENDEFQGLYISEQQVDEFMANSSGMPSWAEVCTDSGAADVETIISRMVENIQTRKKAGARMGIKYRLDEIKTAFSLSNHEIDVLLICLAREIDLRYERLYAYLQNDITKKAPSVDLVLNLLCSSLHDKMEKRRLFSVDMPLQAYNLIELFDHETKQNTSFLGKGVRIDWHIVDFILESSHTNNRIEPYITFLTPDTNLADVQLASDLKQHLGSLHEFKNNNSGGIFYLQGPVGVGKRSTVNALCSKKAVGLIAVDVNKLIKDTDFEDSVRSILREAMLHKSAIYFLKIDELLDTKSRNLLEILLNGIKDLDNLIFLSGESDWEPSNVVFKYRFFKIKFERQNYIERRQIWQQYLADIPYLKEHGVEEISGKFRLTAGQIRNAVRDAQNLAYWRDPEKINVTANHLYAACREQSNHKLLKLAQKIVPNYTWKDIVLPPKKMKHLKEIYNASKFRSHVYDAWGFDKKLSLGKGLNILFSGPSGTGKTMAAEIFAYELGLDFYKIDLSSVVSKYIGETEKNLSQIFSEAETANAILFFDEADALFGKRSEVRDAHDRYANIETGYLLQKMEEYDGVVILATNLDKNMDEAFSRRMHFMIEFPLPGNKERQRIWEKIWPAETPLDDDIDLTFMAEKFNLSGGSIKNISLSAAFLAAESGDSIKMQHLINALQREYQKIGKISTSEEFGKYGKLVML